MEPVSRQSCRWIAAGSSYYHRYIPLDKIAIALLHHPVKGRNGETIASAITNLDLHDIARASKTYGVFRFYAATPLEDQRVLAEKIVGHWQNGAGSTYNPVRGQALELVTVVSGMDEIISDLESRVGKHVRIVATSAMETPRSMAFSTFRQHLEAPENKQSVFLLCLGTAWGLTDEFMEAADFVLAPIRGKSGYNHLSVRSAAAIMLDRLLGDDAPGSC